MILSCRFEGDGEFDGAGSSDARIRVAPDRRNGNATQVAPLVPSESGSLAVEQAGVEVGNTDASLSRLAGYDNASGVRRGRGLIAPPGFALGAGASHSRTATRTVALAAVAVAADEYRCTAAGAKIASSRRFHRR